MSERPKRKSLAPKRRGKGSSRPPQGARISSIRQRSDLFADVARALAHGETLEAKLGALAHALVPELAELCMVHVMNEHGVVRRIDAVHADPSRIEITRDAVQRYGPTPANPVYDVFRSGKPQFTPVVTDDYLVQIAHDAAHLMILRKFGPKSTMKIPIRRDGKTIAVLILSITDSPLLYGRADFELAMEIARRAASSIEGLEEDPPSSRHG